MIEVIPYTHDRAIEWNTFNISARNGHFLFDRAFMEYHADRYVDSSLLVFSDNELVALLPGNRVGSDVVSHGGLTFGGLVLSERATAPRVIAILQEIMTYWRRCGVSGLTYKAVPHIYHRRPTEEDLYALTRLGARLVRRDLTTTIDLRAPGRRGSRRVRGARTARRAGLQVGRSERWSDYWALLHATLEERHGVAPTHSLDEIVRLADLFPDNIRLFVAEEAGVVVAGTVIFETQTVAHAQYIATGLRGRETGALDLVFEETIARYVSEKRFFDFGISTTDAGRVLNEGLVCQKEEFGGSSVVHDVYRLDLI
ncbi:Acetyltransferase (GNAT) domain-containing protein [Methylobacterium phyllostachyos]|uniref:Acetyltransferase (GNAT) domain-containing protein n=1 Tax=Methylobacterium phyllostachyos TaxID=582672 RepID=A0A1H0KCQ5_9HYPH|nr:GNAT family N-acetyltransferase [Methylobacterium phyllostachyos]SDO53522.1 Acetyltransferase (GNAT) domain-containing protein [Methylobacterium phyllostachyos]